MKKVESAEKDHALQRVLHYFRLLPSAFCLLLVRIYQLTLSPAKNILLGPSGYCRFEPSCSQYAIEALKTHGAVTGTWLATKRICRCHPWGAHGEDPVPPKLGKDGALRRHRAAQARNLMADKLSLGSDRSDFRVPRSAFRVHNHGS